MFLLHRDILYEFLLPFYRRKRPLFNLDRGNKKEGIEQKYKSFPKIIISKKILKAEAD
jgi:hypothetical protein